MGGGAPAARERGRARAPGRRRHGRHPGRSQRPVKKAAPPARAAELRKRLERAQHAYYVKDDPETAHAEYDQLVRARAALEAEHPELRTPDSPTHRVGAEPSGAFHKHRHAVPMLSLANAFDESELAEWESRITRLVPDVSA